MTERQPEMEEIPTEQLDSIGGEGIKDFLLGLLRRAFPTPRLSIPDRDHGLDGSQ
jgi:hypothetical protein